MRRLASLLFLLAACGDGAGEPSVDAGPRPDSGPDGPWPVDRVGLVNLVEGGVGGSAGWQSVYASIMNGPELPGVQKKAELGDCAVYVRSKSGFCSPPCPTGVCVEPGICQPWPEPASAGSIVVTGLTAPLTFVPTPYGYDPQPPPDQDLFEPGVSIRLQAPGDATPGFDVSLPAVASLVAPPMNFELRDGEDHSITWTAAGSGRVQLALLVGWHGRPWEAMLLCEAADDGELTIPGALVSELPPASNSLEQHGSTLTRFERALVDAPGGAIEIIVGSQHFVSFSHR